MGATLSSLPSPNDLLDQVVASDAGEVIRHTLARKFSSLDAEDIEDAYQGAYAAARASGSLRGTTAPEVERYFALTAERRLWMLLRRRHYETLEADEASVFQEQVSEVDVFGETADRLDAEVNLELVVHEIEAQLNDRERDVLALYCSRTARKEIAQRLRISEKRAKKDLEAILAKGRTVLVGKAGGGCADGREMVVALAFGMLRNPRELAGAQAHLAGCAACGGLYERLEMFRDAAAAILPLPAGDAATNAGVLERASHKLADAATAAKQHLADATSQTKVHATNAYTRVADPTPLAGARPGAVGAVIASCVAVGSGAAYCAQQGLEPIRSLAGAETKPAAKPATPKPRRAGAADTSPPPPVINTPAAPAAPQPAATTPAPAPPPAATPQPAPEQQGGSTREFDPGAAAAPAQAAPTLQPSRPSTPAPASRGEFTGP